MNKASSQILNFILLVLIIQPLSSLAQAVEAENDTLSLQTSKKKGYGLFIDTGYFGLNIHEISNESKWIAMIPEDIQEARLAVDYLDWTVVTYENILENNRDFLPKFLELNYPERIDTTNIPSWEENTVKVILGKKGKSKVYIVDSNGNYDFRDDTVRILGDINVIPTKQKLVKFHYQRYDGRKMAADSSWIRIGLDANNTPSISAAQHLVSTFNIENQQYEIQVINFRPFFRFGFESPILSITAKNGVKKDSLLLSERLEIGEYLEIGNAYYKFEEVSKSGKTISLIKTQDVSNLIGTQVGFLAP
ncbi:MAG: hypothetical protein AAF696_39255, partial [Bacteroidota bacterium]